jgi:calcineurin-like phosphoesterase family protein
MTNTFFASDHHFGHANILNFLRSDGSPLRSFASIEDHDEHLIAQHNSVVRDKDTCWFLGDVVINRRFLHLISRLNGRKRLVLGNHDIFKNKDYYNAGFEDLHAFRKFDKFACTHIPVHEDSLGRWGVNVHGHVHANRVMIMHNGQRTTKSDSRYVPVCMEHLNDYVPIALEDLVASFA